MNTVEDYLKLSYKIVLLRNEDDSYFAKIEELPGCITEGETIADAIAMIEDAKKNWIATAIDAGIEIPLPESMQKKYSGKFLIRVGKELHRELIRQANENGMSLNAYAVMLLAQNSGMVRFKDEIIDKLLIALSPPQVTDFTYPISGHIPLSVMRWAQAIMPRYELREGEHAS